MPAYNTRRKSISLTALGVHLPTTNASRAHRPNQKSISGLETAPQPPMKKVKRSHDENEPLSPVSSPRSKVGSPAAEVPVLPNKARRGAAEHTPPPSPGDVVLHKKVDTEGINDDIVIAVIEQLEKTGNRPHLIKELATVLAATNDSVAHSANPAALLSSRLSLYLKRPWTALAPCPLAKELIPVHPRKVFFYLTTQPRQAMPENSDDIISPSLQEIKRLTPSISDPSIVDDDTDMEFRERSRMSPSPDVDLDSPELTHGLPVGPPTPGETFSGRSSLNPDGTVDRQHRPNRAPSPPLEADEKGFTETATAVRARGMSLQQPAMSIEPSEEPPMMVEPIEETPEVAKRRDQELGYQLFGHSHLGLNAPTQKMMASSPMIQPRSGAPELKRLNVSFQLEDSEMADASWNLKSPETIEVDDLDDMFSGF